jgi:hypothetical protein
MLAIVRRVEKVEELIVNFSILFDFFFIGCFAFFVSIHIFGEKELCRFREVEIGIVKVDIIAFFLGGVDLSIHSRVGDWLVGTRVYSRVVVVRFGFWNFDWDRGVGDYALSDSAEVRGKMDF